MVLCQLSKRSQCSRHPVLKAVLLAVLLAVLFRLSGSPLLVGGESSGAQIYETRCAACHGAKGEGSEDYPTPLAGSRSIGQLTRFIHQSMPKDDPDKCTAEEAAQVAAYIFETFYSPLAQARIKPARVELSRQTVRQFRHSVADLFGGFRASTAWDDQRGLRGEYFKSRQLRDNERLVDRVDPEIRFDFSDGAPSEGEFDLHQFSIRWQGALFAPDTGEYEFLIRTDHAVRLWINDSKDPLIDGWVKSGSDPIYRANRFLLGGRAYPLKLEFSKAKQGVDDSAKNKDKLPAKAMISLEWKPPQRGIAELIPARSLFPGRVSPVFVLTTPFPPDDRSIGYERGVSVSKEWDQAATAAAIEVATYVARRWPELAGTRADAADHVDRARAFCLRFVEAAFRRPLTDELRQAYVDRHFADGLPLEATLNRIALLALKSPRFLYPELDTRAVDSRTRASRLALYLWDSIPDADLSQAATAGALETRAQLVQQAERMFADPRTAAKLREYLLQWLRVDPMPDLAKDASAFPDFEPGLVSDLRTSLELFLEQLLKSDAADFRQLLLADTLVLNGRLAHFYGAELPANAPFQLVKLSSADRAGLLTHPYVLANFAYRRESSPIHRGVFVARSLLGRTLHPPPDAFVPVPAELHPSLTTRERVALQTKPDACAKCHALINPLGFPLERFDAVGRLRELENGKPIDASGSYQALTGDSVLFSGARDLANFIAQSEEAHSTFVEHLFHNLIKQPIRAFGPSTLADLRESFVRNEFNIRKLAIEITVLAAMRTNESPDS